MRRRFLFSLFLGLAFSTIGDPVATAAQTFDLRGAWRPESYVMKDGSRSSVDGLIFFTEKDWAVLFFVTENGEPRRGAAEGGTYTLQGGDLVFTHLYHFSSGKAVGALPESPLRMEIKDAAAGTTEPCRVEIEADRLTIRFLPSGNSMIFRRSSRF
jgi:hypothetical protein